MYRSNEKNNSPSLKKGYIQQLGGIWGLLETLARCVYVCTKTCLPKFKFQRRALCVKKLKALAEIYPVTVSV
jgi:hypothetical protein